MTPNLAKAECTDDQMLIVVRDQVELLLERLPLLKPKPGRKYEREMQALKTALTCAKSALDDLTA